jgi:16S rRNA C1402 N4-methylase RsmH
MFNPDKKTLIESGKGIRIRLSQELVSIQDSLQELADLDSKDFSQNTVLTKELSEEIIKDRIKKERFWNFFVKASKTAKFVPPQNRKIQILDLACSVCEEKEVLHSFFGGEKSPYYNDNDNAIITGVDIDEEAIELAEQNLPKDRENNFKFIIGDVSNLENIDGLPQKADVVLMLHHQMIKPNYNKGNVIEVELWKKMVNEAINKLNPGGFFVITSYTKKEHQALVQYLSNIESKAQIIADGINEFAEPLGAGGIDKFYVIIKKQNKE